MEEANPFVLVVDDDPVNLQALEYHLTRAAYQPVLAEDGEKGWALLEDEPEKYATVLLDRTMPKMDGMEVLSRIKQHEQLRAIPVIFQTARTREQDVVEGLEAGAYYYLTKPFSKKTLLAIVKTAVSDQMRYRRLRSQARETIGSFSLMRSGTYAFRTVEEGQLLAVVLAKCCAEPERVVLGLAELLTNAVEHGNLGIGYEEKSRLLEEDQWFAEVGRRLALPENREKQVTIEVERKGEETRYRIVDQGRGFDWREYLEIGPERAFDTHGRGIAMSRALSFDLVEFVGKGNEVIAVAREPRAP